MASTRHWTAADIPPLAGRLAVVTGGNGGLGLEIADQLAGHGARVLIAARDLGKADGALRRIRGTHSAASVDVVALDLADLDSVRRCAGQLAGYPVDLLINNAGVMAIPLRYTAQGFEMQIGTNHLGHFALAGLLLPGLLHRPGARIVTMSSMAHIFRKIDIATMAPQQPPKSRYRRWRAYGQSKLANLMFTYELDRRIIAAGGTLTAVAAHPGYAATDLQTVGAQMSGRRLTGRAMHIGNALFAQSAAQGALPALYAATEPDVQGGGYFGPDGIGGAHGYPVAVGSSKASLDRSMARRLWEWSEQMTEVKYEFPSRVT
jgi:NAD(P)-dependent dehydrogenase (short-subunit alcohol dehydrogenase family)